MHRALTVSALAALTLSIAACKESGTTVSQNQPQAAELNVADEPGVDNQSAAPGAPAVPVFAANAAGNDQFEIAAGKLAQARGGSDAVKQFGAELVSEHTRSTAELKAAVDKLQPPLILPTQPSPANQAKLQALQGLSGVAFDKQFIADQQVDHQQALTSLNAYIADGESGPVRDWARRATGMVQKHLQQLNRLNGNASL